MKMPYTEALLRSIPKLDEPEPHPAGGHPRPAPRPGRPAGRAAAFAPRCPYAQDTCRPRSPRCVPRPRARPRLPLLVPGGLRRGRRRPGPQRRPGRRLARTGPTGPGGGGGERRRGRQRHRSRRTRRGDDVAAAGRGPRRRVPGGAAGRCTPCPASASTSPRARPWAWWASPVAASRPPAGPSCSSPNARPRASVVLRGHRPDQASGPASCARSGPRCR